jgi:predicted N-acyltransferase
LKSLAVKSFPFTDLKEFSIYLYTEVHDIPAAEWNSCITNTNIFLSLDYLSVAENSELPGMQFRYAILKKHDIAVAVLYFQLVNLSDKGLGNILSLDEYGGMAAGISTRINDLLFKPGGEKKSFILVCGNLLVSGEHGIAAKDDNSFSHALASISSVKKSISATLESKSRIVAYMVKDFYNEKDLLAAAILKKEYFLLNTDPEMIFSVRQDWKTFEDYLSALSSKYRIRANNVRSKASGLKIKLLSLQEIKSLESKIFELNDNVINRAPVKLARPSSSYFVNLKKAFNNHYCIKGFFLEDKMIAFTSALWNKNHFEAHYIGLDYHFNQQFSLYQNLLYSYIEDAILYRSSTLYFGRTALEIKSTTGAKPFPLHCYFRFGNRVINTLARPLVSSTGPGSWIPRDPFRK